MTIKTMFFILLLSIAFYFGAGIPTCASPELNFGPSDRVLILAPHPDDEAIGVGGIIGRALNAKAKIKVVCFTNGDNNEVAFLVYKKHPVLSAKGLIMMGETRRKETIAAMTGMGMRGEDIEFLGYPDFGTLAIFTEYWDDTAPYRAMLTKQTKVPYPEAVSYGTPYVGESILKDLKDILTTFQPTAVFVSHPADSNSDHKALYLFLRVALWDLADTIEQPSVYPYIVHVVGWPVPKGYHPELALEPPRDFKEIMWGPFALTKDEVIVKHNAISKYKSQIGCDPPYLFTFARKNELFGDYPMLYLKKGSQQGIYSLKDGNILVRIALANVADKERDFTVYLIGYKRGTDFSSMPKMRIRIDPDGLHCRDGHCRFHSKEIELTRDSKALTLKVPVKALGDPDYIFAHVDGRIEKMPCDDTNWRILILGVE